MPLHSDLNSEFYIIDLDSYDYVRYNLESIDTRTRQCWSIEHKIARNS